MNYGIGEFEFPEFKEIERNTDLTALVIGDFGSWQRKVCILMILLKLPLAWYQLNIVFMAPNQEFWCAKPANFKSSEEQWRKICTPLVREYQCFIYDPDILAMAPETDRKYIPLVKCPKFTYDNLTFTRTIISDWDLVCDKHWLVHLSQCIMMWGIVVGGILFGILADKYGRKKPLMCAIIMQTAFSYIVCLTFSYWWFLVFWYTLAVASGGVGIISFVMCMEAVSGKYRTILPVLYQIPFGFGTAALAGMAYFLRDWRILEFALASLSALFVLYWFFLPESIRWLLATGQTRKALKALKNAARYNGMAFNKYQVKKLLLRYKSNQNQKEPGYKAFLKSKKMRSRTILLSINWFCTGLSFFTFSQYLGSIGQNIYLAISLSGFLSILGGIICLFIITRVGRKTTVGIFQLVTAICFVMLLLTPNTNTPQHNGLRLLFAGIGFAGMAGSIPALYLFSGELFPTQGRNMGISGVTTFARIASMGAPIIVYLDSKFVNLPLVMLTIMTFLQIFLLLPLPETKDQPLPDTLEEAELS